MLGGVIVERWLVWQDPSEAAASVISCFWRQIVSVLQGAAAATADVAL